MDGEIVIIGAGLTGLTIGAILEAKGVDFRIIESRERCGGRIFTEGYKSNQPIELGATWLGYQHKHLLKFLESLGIDTFIQEFGDRAHLEPISTSPPYVASIPQNEQPSFRIKGGTASLISALVEKVGSEHVYLSERVLSLSLDEDKIEVKTDKGLLTASKVISTLPPNLLVNRVRFMPELPVALTSIAKTTHTWMGESIKIALSYKEPFWRSENSTGTVLSNVGPINELYDHCNYEKSFFALKGFFNGGFFSVTREERLEKVMNQLRKYFGARIEDYLGYHEKVWRNDPDTFQPYDEHILPHQNNAHPIYQNTFYDGRLIIAGSETSPIYPGYMEGAVYSAKNAVRMLNDMSA